MRRSIHHGHSGGRGGASWRTPEQGICLEVGSTRYAPRYRSNLSMAERPCRASGRSPRWQHQGGAERVRGIRSRSSVQLVETPAGPFATMFRIACDVTRESMWLTFRGASAPWRRLDEPSGSWQGAITPCREQPGDAYRCVGLDPRETRWSGFVGGNIVGSCLCRCSCAPRSDRRGDAKRQVACKAWMVRRRRARDDQHLRELDDERTDRCESRSNRRITSSQEHVAKGRNRRCRFVDVDERRGVETQGFTPRASFPSVGRSMQVPLTERQRHPAHTEDEWRPSGRRAFEDRASVGAVCLAFLDGTR